MTDALIVQHAQTVLRVVHGDNPKPESEPTPIGASWTRCVNDYHLEPSRLYSPTVVDHSQLHGLQEQHSELIEIARAEMDTLYDQISGSGYALLLTDANGIILCDKVDPTLRQMFRSAGLIGGADWSEQHEGTNGIGTCITEGRSVTIHRADHFRSRHIGLSCSGAPIRDTGGDVIAVLDASSVDARDTRSSQMHTMALVNFSAHMIEKCLFLRRFQHQSVLRFHHRPELVNLLHDGAIALSDNGIVLGADATAAKLLGCSHRNQLIGHAIDELFDSGVRELAQLGGSARNAIWQLRDLRHGRHYFAALSSNRIAEAPAPMPTRPIRTVVEVAPCEALTSPMTLDFIAGEDPQMLRIARSASRIAKSNVSVLIRGPTGSGKECFAKALHLASDRAEKPYVAVNCAAIPESLIESELFGYKSGAFTGARKEGMRGKVLQSNGGTLFLDEIGDMPLLLQTRLLRVLEEREVVPLGAETPIKVDLRVICASHRDLRVMMDQGTFREDLFYRLNGITLELPALSQRSDKEQLIRQIIAAETSSGRPVAVEAEAFQHLMDYPWPGNIRELRNVIRTALAICEGGVIRVHDLPAELRATPASAARGVAQAPALPAPAPTAGEPAGNCLEAAERAALISAIERNRWNMSQTAAELGMSRNTLYRKIKRHGIPIGARRWDSL